MKKKKKEFKLPTNRQPFYKAFKPILRMIFKRPEIINLAGEVPDKAIIIANHSNKSGPPALDLYYPKPSAKWGAHQMFGNFKSRRDYLRDVLYIKKCGASKTKASLISPILAIFNPLIYKGMKMVLPTYQDVRLVQTIKNSCTVLDANMSVMIFPEDSNEGYKDVLTGLFPGFVMLAEKYYKTTGEDVPIITVYYCIRKKIMIIDKPAYIQDYVKEGLDKYQIAEKFRLRMNQLYYDYVEDKVNEDKPALDGTANTDNSVITAETDASASSCSTKTQP